MNTTEKELDAKDIQAILVTLLEKSFLTALHYSQSAGRDNISSTDMKYALRYQAHEYLNTPGLAEDVDKNYDPETESEPESEPESESETFGLEKFTRSESTDPLVVKINEYHDNWDTWQPDNLVELLLKRAVDKAC